MIISIFRFSWLLSNWLEITFLNCPIEIRKFIFKSIVIYVFKSPWLFRLIFYFISIKKIFIFWTWFNIIIINILKLLVWVSHWILRNIVRVIPMRFLQYYMIQRVVKWRIRNRMASHRALHFCQTMIWLIFESRIVVISLPALRFVHYRRWVLLLAVYCFQILVLLNYVLDFWWNCVYFFY